MKSASFAGCGRARNVALISIALTASLAAPTVIDSKTALRLNRSVAPCNWLAVTSEPLVSIDFNHEAASSTVALPQTQVIEGKLGRVLAWYDNEWGFSTRMSDTAVAMAKLI